MENSKHFSGSDFIKDTIIKSAADNTTITFLVLLAVIISIIVVRLFKEATILGFRIIKEDNTFKEEGRNMGQGDIQKVIILAFHLQFDKEKTL